MAYVRPHEFAFAANGEPAIPATVTSVLAAGSAVRIDCLRPSGEVLEVALPSGVAPPHVGERIHLEAGHTAALSRGLEPDGQAQAWEPKGRPDVSPRIPATQDYCPYTDEYCSRHQRGARPGCALACHRNAKPASRTFGIAARIDPARSAPLVETSLPRRDRGAARCARLCRWLARRASRRPGRLHASPPDRLSAEPPPGALGAPALGLLLARRDGDRTCRRALDSVAHPGGIGCRRDFLRQRDVRIPAPVSAGSGWISSETESLSASARVLSAAASASSLALGRKIRIWCHAAPRTASAVMIDVQSQAPDAQSGDLARSPARHGARARRVLPARSSARLWPAIGKVHASPTGSIAAS